MIAVLFAFDAAGLDGLMRFASLAALGFSLIGVAATIQPRPARRGRGH
jgi:hypothetical protein